MPKENSITKMKAEKEQLSERARQITAKAKSEKRMLNEDETKELGEIQCRMAEINIDIAKRESENFTQNIVEEKRENNFSLRKTLLDLSEGKLSNETRSINEAGAYMMQQNGISKRGNGVLIPVQSFKRAAPAFTATGTPDTGSGLIQTDFFDIQKPLRNRLILGQAGATMLTGLVSNIEIPTYSGSKAHWAAENAAAQEDSGKFTYKTMKPHRLTALLTISRQLLVQDSLNVEQVLRSDLIDAISEQLELTAFGGAAHNENTPDGLFTGYTDAAIPFSWANLVDMETEADVRNALAENSNYVFHTKLRGAAKVLPKATQGVLGFLMESDGTLNGYNVLRSNSVYSKDGAYGAVFGNWADLIIGQWGALEMIVDPYTNADTNMIRIIVHSYWDFCVRRDESFSKALFTLTPATT